MKKIGIIVLNWNNYDDTKKCLVSIIPSISSADTIKVELFLIDNDSKDKSGDLLAKEYGNKIQYYNTGHNGGYTGGNNFGIVKAVESKCDYILVLNNDLEIQNFSSLLSNVDKVFESDKTIGILGFEIYNSETKKILKHQGSADNIFNKLLKIENKKVMLSEDISIVSQRSVCGCAICFKTTCIDEIGLFDENFFMYAEEHDICLRAIRFGWNVVRIEDKKIKIYREIDAISESQLIWFYGTRNIFCTYRKNLIGLNKYIFFAVQLFIYFKQVIHFVINKQSNISFKIIKGLWAGIVGENCNMEKKN